MGMMRHSNLSRRVFETTAPRATILIRVAVALVFVSEGIQRFVYPNALGAGRFAKIGIPAPEVMGRSWVASSSLAGRSSWQASSPDSRQSRSLSTWS